MFNIIVITAENIINCEAEIINTLFHSGLSRLHLRKPKATYSQMEEIINCIDKRYYDRIVVHDHHELAVKYNLGGIHINSRNRERPIGYNGSVSCSCHSISELKDKRDEFDYLSLSPIFNSISKEGYQSNFTASQLIKARKDGIIDDKVYALGGVDADNISLLGHYGFGGAMILGYMWDNDGDKAVERFIHILRSINS